MWANAGYIVDFEACKAKYPEFADVIDSLWKSGTWNGKVWAVPQDTEARPMFYSKTKLQSAGLVRRRHRRRCPTGSRPASSRSTT